MSLNEAQFGPYYHGTSTELQPGDVLHPPGQEGPRTFPTPHAAYSPEHVYFTTSQYQAESYAQGRALRHGGEPQVYEVQPHGEVEKDPETAGVKGWDVSYRSPRAVVKRAVGMRE